MIQLLALTVSLLLATSSFADDKATPGKAQPQPPANKPPNILLESRLMKRPFLHTSLDDLLRHMKDDHKITIELDRESFGGQHASIGKSPVHQYSLPLPIGVHLELAANQIGGTVAWEGQRIKIVRGGPQSLERFLTSASKKIAQKTELGIEVKELVFETPLSGAVEYFSDWADVSIVVHEGLFREAGVKNVQDSLVMVLSGRKTLKSWLFDTAAQVDGKVLFFEECIVIVPWPKKPPR